MDIRRDVRLGGPIVTGFFAGDDFKVEDEVLVHPPLPLIGALEQRRLGVEAIDSRVGDRAWGVLRGEGRWIAAALYPFAQGPSAIVSRCCFKKQPKSASSRSG
jgi:hypothetical protein